MWRGEVFAICDCLVSPWFSFLIMLVRLFLGIDLSQSFVPQIVFTKPEIYIELLVLLFRIFGTVHVRKSRLSQTSDVDNCSKSGLLTNETLHIMQVLVAF